MALPSRADFIAGLVPVSTLLPYDTDCGICLEAFTNPVILPCNHVFDRDCIVQYLQTTDRNNSCPYCRHKLCVSPYEEQLDGSPLVLDGSPLVRALRAALVALPHLWDFGLGDVSIPELTHATSSAMGFLALVHSPAASILDSLSGSTLLNMQLLTPRMIMMGNLIIQLAAIEGRPYEGRQLEAWAFLIESLHGALAARDGEELDPLILQVQLRNEITLGEYLDQADLFSLVPPHAYSPTSYDLDNLIRYVTLPSTLPHTHVTDPLPVPRRVVRFMRRLREYFRPSGERRTR